MRRALLILLACGASARADVTVGVTLTPDGEALARQLGLTTADLQQRIAAHVDDVFATAHVPEMLRSFSDAAAFSERGLGVDYGSLPRGVVFGIAGTGTLAANDQLGGSNMLARGLAANFAAMAGLNLARWNAPRWTVYANGFYQSAGTDELTGALTSGGAHVQVAAIEPQPSTAVLRWIGVDVTTGVEITQWSLGMDAPISRAFTITGNAQSADVALASSGRFDVTAMTTTLPLEVTTGLRLAGVVATYVGGGVDVDVGQASLTAQTSGNLTDASGHMLGTLAIAGTASRSGTPLVPRALAGTQLELGQFKLFAQVNAAPSLASLGVGIRFVL